MNEQRHPIDELFRQGLTPHSEPPPMHIWERIETQREANRINTAVVPLYQTYMIAAGLAAALFAGFWLSLPLAPELGNFPIPAMIADAEASAPAEEPTAVASASVTDQTTNIATLVKPLSTTPVRRLPVTTEAPVIETVLPDLAADEISSPVRAPAVYYPASTQLLTAAALPGLTQALEYRIHSLESMLLPIPETGCARFSNGRPALFLSLSSGPVLAGRDIEASDPEYEDYARQRSITENPALSFGANARLSLVFPWGGALRTGMSFTQINENFIFRNSKVRQTTITDIYGPNGEVIGSDTTYITENTTLQHNNYHRLIDIPLQLGYEIRYDKVTLAINGGVNINLAYRQKGNYLGPRDLLPTEFGNDSTDSEEPIYKDRVGLSWQAGLGLHYQLKDNLDITAEPYLRYYPQSFTQTDYPLTQHYLVGGVGIGLRLLL